MVSLIGLSTCLVISLRKAENFIFSFIKFFLASFFLLSCSFSSSFPCPSLSLGLVRASIDLALRKLPSFPDPLIILWLLFGVPWVAPHREDWPFSRFCLAGCLFTQPLLSIKGAVSSPSSKYLFFPEISVQDCEC